MKRLLILSVLISSGCIAGPESGLDHVRPPDQEVQAYHDQARETVTMVLSHPEFEDLVETERAIPPWLKDILSQVGKTAEWLLKAVPRPIWWLICLWLIVSFVAIVVHLIYSVIAPEYSHRQATRKSEQGLRGKAVTLANSHLDFESSWEAACDKQNAGDFLMAIKYFLATALLWLERQGRVVRKPSKTDAAYLMELRSAPRERQFYSHLTAISDPCVYGNRHPANYDCEQMKGLIQQFVHGFIESQAN